MNATRRRHRPTHQPQLPLRPSGPEGDTGGDQEWRLDDQTRLIGKQGVALARARLLGGGTGGGGGDLGGVVGTDGPDGTGSDSANPRRGANSDTEHRSGGRGPTGRAA